MAYKYLEHEADIGLEASGKDIEEVFEQGAKGLFNAMFNIKKIKAEKEIELECSAPDIPGLYIEWLNELLAQKDIHELIFSAFKVEITKEDKEYKLKGHALGEAFKESHEPKTEVKAATYHGLKYEEKDNMHTITCVLDV